MSKKIMLCANRDFVLYNFRFELIEKMIIQGNDVYICLPYGPKVDLMTKAGAKFVPINIDGRGTNPIVDYGMVLKYIKAFKDIKPDVILTYTTKVCIYAGIVARKLHIPYIENVSGLGSAVEKPGILQPLMISLYKMAIKDAKCVYFQNDENERFFIEHQIDCIKKKRIPGSGVNLKKWIYLEYPNDNEIHFLFIARIIREKGIEQYLYAASEIKKRYSNVYFHILGPCDGDYENVINENVKNGIVKYHGMVQDTGEYLRFAHCLVHPSFYPEGISNVLLEACASGRPIITTDRSGCREVVDDGVNGYMVKCQDGVGLVNAIEKFLGLSWNDKKKMGLAARKKVELEFDRQIVIDDYMDEIDQINKDNCFVY